MQGLRPEIRKFVKSREIPTCEKAMEYARVGEDEELGMFPGSQPVVLYYTEMPPPPSKKLRTDVSVGSS